jgi:hypothetical protein
VDERIQAVRVAAGDALLLPANTKVVLGEPASRSLGETFMADPAIPCNNTQSVWL